jgi:hypothetical protein
VLKVEQTLSCDICSSEIKSDTQIVYSGTQMYNIGRGPAGMTQWQDICNECHGPLMKAFFALKTAKAAE